MVLSLSANEKSPCLKSSCFVWASAILSFVNMHLHTENREWCLLSMNGYLLPFFFSSGKSDFFFFKATWKILLVFNFLFKIKVNSSRLSNCSSIHHKTCVCVRKTANVIIFQCHSFRNTIVFCNMKLISPNVKYCFLSTSRMHDTLSLSSKKERKKKLLTNQELFT